MKKYLAILLVVPIVFLLLTSCSHNNENIVELGVEVNEQPQKVEEVKKELVEELVASSFTTFDSTNTSRSNNIKLSGSHINGLILEPGDEFSFNNVVGQRTAERGFLPAGIFVSTESGTTTVNGYGGGVCQTSSTVCMAVKQTSMEILERNIHSSRVAYTTIDNEAMINWGTSDFRFKNNYDDAVRLEILFYEVDGTGKITCNIYMQKYV